MGGIRLSDRFLALGGRDLILDQIVAKDALRPVFRGSALEVRRRVVVAARVTDVREGVSQTVQASGPDTGRALDALLDRVSASHS